MHHHHHHGHVHSHGGHHAHSAAGEQEDDPRSPEERSAAVRRALRLALALNGGFLLIEAGIGWWSGSLALLSDAVHMLSDVGALVVALGAARLALRPADDRRSFGYGRAEVLGAFVNGLALLAACAVIVREAIGRLVEGPPEVAALPVLVVGGIGLAINLGSAWALARSDRDNLNIKGALAHMLADALGSAGAMLAALLLWLGVPAADPLISLGVAALVLWSAWRVLAEATRVLLQFAPPGVEPARVRADLLDLDGVVGVHDLHIWTLDGRRPVLSAHIVAATDVAERDVLLRAHELLHDQWRVHHATLQVERPGDCQGGCFGEEVAVSTGEAHEHP